MSLFFGVQVAVHSPPDDPWRERLLGQLRGATHDLRLAVSYLSARLGERVARGDAVNLGDYEQSVLSGDDYFHLRASLSPDQHRRLQDVLQSPEIVRTLHDLVGALREPSVR